MRYFNSLEHLYFIESLDYTASNKYVINAFSDNVYLNIFVLANVDSCVTHNLIAAR